MRPRVYVVHLSWATARRQRLEPQLQRSGLEYEFVEGVDGRKLTESERAVLIDASESAKYPNWLTPGVLGATLGHKCAYDAIARADDDVALVLENDAELPANFGALLSQLAEHVGSREVMLLNFRSLQPIVLRLTGGVECGDYRVLSPTQSEHIASACAYLLRRETAIAMADALLPARWAPDTWNRYIECGAVSGLKCVFPQPVQQDIGTRSLARHGSDTTLLKRIQQCRILPLHAARILNRYRIRRRMTRVTLVD
jgi:glycosyl transferase, family 25